MQLVTALAAVLLPAVLVGAIPARHPFLASRAESVDMTCGSAGAGAGKNMTCPTAAPCCSSYGYCGSEDAFCLTTAGCQGDFSAGLNATSACRTPGKGTVSPDGTCGVSGVGQHGYRCPGSGYTCCSVAGWCGNSSAHCAVENGCQDEFGTCASPGSPKNATAAAAASMRK